MPKQKSLTTKDLTVSRRAYTLEAGEHLIVGNQVWYVVWAGPGTYGIEVAATNSEWKGAGFRFSPDLPVKVLLEA